VPELTTGSRYHNTYLLLAWLIEITSYFNSSFNIFVYYGMGSRYRETVKELFCRWRVAPNQVKKQTVATVAGATVSTD